MSPRFTQKHFRAIAATLLHTRPSDNGWQTTANYRQWRLTVEALADGFAEDNPRFDRQRFYTACGRTR